jgi:predicted nucleic acid-binding protein
MALGEILSSFESHRRVRFKKLSAGFEIVPVDAEVAAKAAEIRVENRIALGDAIITALIHDTELLTFDKRMQSVFERLR